MDQEVIELGDSSKDDLSKDDLSKDDSSKDDLSKDDFEPVEPVDELCDQEEDLHLDAAVEYQINAKEMALAGDIPESGNDSENYSHEETVTEVKSLLMDEADSIEREESTDDASSEPVHKRTKCSDEDFYNQWNPSPCDSGRRTFSFMDLSSDVLVKVFKFLDFKERTRIERVHSSLVRVMNVVWSRQKSLVVSFGPTFQNNLCHHKDHGFCFEDIFYDQESGHCHLDRSFFRVVAKCPNLKSLRLLSNSVATKSFGRDVYGSCPDLEHVEIRDATTVVAFSSYVESGRGSLTCLQVNEFDEEADEEMEEALVSVIKNSERLDTFMNHSIWNTRVVVEVVAPRVKDYRVVSFPDMSLINLICTLGSENLESFGIREIIPLNQAMEIVEALPRLRSLEVNVEGEGLRVWFRHVTRVKREGGEREGGERGRREREGGERGGVPLEEITLYPGHDYYEIRDNEYFLSNHGRHLKSLTLYSYHLGGTSLAYIHQFCPDLETLAIYARQSINMRACFRSIGRLTRLKCLILKELVVTNQQFGHVLRRLVNLEEIHLINFDLTPVRKNQLVNYASDHKTRIINVYLDFKLKQVAPPYVPGTRPNYSYDISECYENLRLWYCH